MTHHTVTPRRRHRVRDWLGGEAATALFLAAMIVVAALNPKLTVATLRSVRRPS